MIQLRRGTSAQRLASDDILSAGQPFFETDTNRLYVGDNTTQLKDLIAVNNNILNDVNDSIVLKYSGIVDTDHYQSKALGESEALLGEANTDTASAKRNLVAGKLNIVRNSNIIVGGLKNDVSGVHSFVTGNDNTMGIHGGASRACGSTNYINAYTSSVDGDNNDLSKNTAGQKDIHVQGRYNVSDYNDTNLYGQGLRASKDNQTLVGRYNAYAQDNTSTFVVGIGTDNPTRKTGLRVKDNGNVEAPNASPSADKDLITKVYANNNYVKQITGSGTNKAYIHTSSGAEGTTTMAESAAAWTLVYRGDGGRFQAGTPVLDNDVATKAYVDATHIEGTMINNQWVSLTLSTPYSGYQYGMFQTIYKHSISLLKFLDNSSPYPEWMTSSGSMYFYSTYPNKIVDGNEITLVQLYETYHITDIFGCKKILDSSGSNSKGYILDIHIKPKIDQNDMCLYYTKDSNTSVDPSKTSIYTICDLAKLFQITEDTVSTAF